MIPDELSVALTAAARKSGASEAELTRRALAAYLQGAVLLERYPLVVRQILLAPDADVSGAAEMCRAIVQRCTTGANGNRLEGAWRALANLCACIRYLSEDLAGPTAPTPGA